MTPLVGTSGFDGGTQAAGAVDGVNGAHVVPMTAEHRYAGFEIDAERRPEEHLLGVVDGQGVAREQGVNVAAADELDEVAGSAGVDDNRPSHENDALAARLGLTDHRGDARDAHLDSSFRRHLVRHEGKIAALAIAELRRHAQAVEAADHSIADLDLAQLATRRSAVGADHDDRIHALARDGQPAAIDAHVGPHVRRRVEIVRHRAIAIRDPQQRVPFLDGMAAERNQLLEQTAQAGVGRRRHLQLQLREVVVGAADLEMQDLELTAALDHGIEDGVQELRVDEVALSLDDDGVRGCVGHGRNVDYSHGFHRQHGMRRHGFHGPHGMRGDHGAVVNVRAAGEERQLWPWQA